MNKKLEIVLFSTNLPELTNSKFLLPAGTSEFFENLVH